MSRRTSGFTMVELVIALLIGTILTSIALSSFNTAQNAFAIRGAKNMYATLHQRARAKAVELGRTMIYLVDVYGDSAFIYDINLDVTPMTFEITDITRFREEMNVDLRSSTGSYYMCFTPRGYADVDCPYFSAFGLTATDTDPIRLEFWLNADSTSIGVLPMGQLVGM